MSQTITLGLELEAVELTPGAGDIIRDNEFQLHRDASIQETDGSAPRNSGEIVSGVIGCEFNESDLSVDTTDVARIIERLCACAARVNTTCGLHVHVGKPQASTGLRGSTTAGRRSKWAPEDVFTWLKIGLDIEAKLLELVPESRARCSHAKKIAESFNTRDLFSHDPVGTVVARKYDNQKRYCWLNLVETKRQGTESVPGRAASGSPGTVEIRLLGNTKRPDYILAWTRMCAALAGVVAYSPHAANAILKAQYGLESYYAAVRDAKNRVRRMGADAATPAPSGRTRSPARDSGYNSSSFDR